MTHQFGEDGDQLVVEPLARTRQRAQGLHRLVE
jgi:hypothetical protein